MATMTATQVSVRRLQEEDEAMLEQMYASFEPKGVALGLPPSDRARRKTWLARLRAGINLVAVVEGTIVGHLALMRIGCSAETVVFVHQDFRRRGIATSLAQAAVAEARAQGARFLWVLISGSNSAAHAGLLKFGFRTNWEGLGEAQMVYRL